MKYCVSHLHILAEIKPLACLDCNQIFSKENGILGGLRQVDKVEMHLLLTLRARAVQSYNCS